MQVPRRILVAEDDADLLDLLQQLIEAGVRGAEVLAASSGADALRIASERPVDLLVTDYSMPGMTGLELVVKLRERDPELPAILLTAFREMEVAIRAVDEARVQSFLSKPVDPQQVVRVVNGILEAWRPRPTGVRSITPRSGRPPLEP